ncbi:MAG: hypothetical protein DHS20C17_00860 [Cyclobacteriaceae bacterium]|nr:MAG: hypothetical protein DHS20C17_00860 [Cyclobacteriaceae bacterium]
MKEKAQKEAEKFLNKEKQFHLGVLPTEQSNPKTHNLDSTFNSNPSEGARMLLSVDWDVHKMAERVLLEQEYHTLVDTGVRAILEGKKIVLSGCGATGRLSILLESMWRYYFKSLTVRHPKIYSKTRKFENAVFSIMTGGDYALIRSVEHFEDYQEFGKQQVREMQINAGDVLIAITEGGETSSVLGTVIESAERGALPFLVYNNPTDILCKYIDRSRIVIEDPRVTVIDLYCGPMAVAGSTRMQATTAEQLIVGAALETILSNIFIQVLSQDELSLLNIGKTNYSDLFKALLIDLLAEKNLKTISELMLLERSVYEEDGLVTYFANEFLLDIFTDTTERAPTFAIPPFKKLDDHTSPPSWAFVKNPTLTTNKAWDKVLGRVPRCLNWTRDLYYSMGALPALADSPPQLDKSQLLKFRIGNEEDTTRLSKTHNAAISIVGNTDIESTEYNAYKSAFNHHASEFQQKYRITIGNNQEDSDYKVTCALKPSLLNLMEHMAFKLVLNTVSTGTMTLMGRVTGNWMSWVEVSNKKLRDRGIRLISEICGLNYQNSCYKLHETLEELKATKLDSLSPVQYTIKKIKEGENV